MNEKTRNQLRLQKFYQKDKRLGCPPRKILETILEMDKGKLEEPRGQESLRQCARPYI